MLSYRFWAHSPDGEAFEGVIQAESLEDVHKELEVRRLIPKRIVEEPTALRVSLRRAPSTRAMVEFSHQLATLVESFVPLVPAIEMVSSITRDRPLREALEETLVDVRAGSPLAEAMSEHPKVFADIFIATVAAGEEGGTMGVALRRMADYLERRRAIREGILGAVAYPAVIVAAAVVSVVMVLLLVIPTFERIFASSGLELPASTLLFVTLSRLFARYWLLGVIFPAVAIFGLRRWHRTEHGRRTFDGVLLRLPGIGGLAGQFAVARFSRTAALLLASGVSILVALQAASRTCGNIVIGKALSRGRESVAAGGSLAEQLARESTLPPLLGSMVAIGEETGELDRMLDKVADFHEREIQASINGLLKVIEPALVILVGVFLAAIVISIYLPIFEAISTVG